MSVFCFVRKMADEIVEKRAEVSSAEIFCKKIRARLHITILLFILSLVLHSGSDDKYLH